MEIFQWVSTEDAWNICSIEEFTHVKEELADVMIYYLSLANKLNIDVAASIEDKIAKNGFKYPIDNEEKGACSFLGWVFEIFIERIWEVQHAENN